jgi:hypothetical protein
MTVLVEMYLGDQAFQVLISGLLVLALAIVKSWK